MPTSQHAASAPEQHQAAPQAQLGTTAMRAARDKVTGNLRRANQADVQETPAAEAAERWARGLPDPATAPLARQVLQRPNGTLCAVVGTEHLVTMMAVRGADGRLVRNQAHRSAEHPISKPQQRPTK